ncbi:hypothetical protein RRG08_036121 [Elysia crispata]|uniref:Uncharacterized protein n=1 Tax=Elysia crispata TaxID=231223 RepID=A0AAE1ALG2_9GAST|nr:hypothetical protein RRG08_036121 [Elysia crispata]
MTKNRFRAKPTLDCYDATGILSFAGGTSGLQRVATQKESGQNYRLGEAKLSPSHNAKDNLWFYFVLHHESPLSPGSGRTPAARADCLLVWLLTGCPTHPHNSLLSDLWPPLPADKQAQTAALPWCLTIYQFLTSRG